MKKTVILALASILSFASCKKDNSTSKIVKVPSMELVGTAVYSTPVGSGSYSDPGALFIDEEGVKTTLSSPTSSNVDLSTPGFYSATYTKKTEYGYNVSVSRLILVTPVSPSIDYSGTYYRNTNSSPCNVTKIGPGLYKTDNVGGVNGLPSYIFDVYFGMIDNSTIIVPTQPNPLGGDIYCTNSTLTISGADTTIQWAVMGAGFGTAVRKFIK